MFEEDMPLYARKCFEDGYSEYLTARVPQTIYKAELLVLFQLHRSCVSHITAVVRLLIISACKRSLAINSDV